MVTFIVNPAAGHGRAGARWRAAYALVSHLEHKVALTERPGHGRELARQALENGATLVVAVGGDGSLGEVVDGFLSVPEKDRAGAAVATFPCGSGCDFAAHMKIPREPVAWVAAFERATVSKIDAALASFSGRSRHFLNVAAAGLPGDVALAVARRGKFLGGTLTYLLEGALAAATSVPRRMRLRLDGKEEEGDYHLFAAANTSTFGGGMRLAPDADVTDGLLDVLTIAGVSRAALLALLPRAYSGGHLGRPGVMLGKARRVEILSGAGLPLNLDGDAEGETPAVFEALPGVLPFRC